MEVVKEGEGGSSEGGRGGMSTDPCALYLVLVWLQ